MESQQRGFSLFWRQTIALLKKNFLLSMRNKRATFLQLFSSLFFLGLLFGIQQGMTYRSKHPSAIHAVDDPQPLRNPPIPPCEHKFFIKRPCYDFVWSGSGNKRIESIVLGILANNPGRPIHSSKVKMTWFALFIEVFCLLFVCARARWSNCSSSCTGWFCTF